MEIKYDIDIKIKSGVMSKMRKQITNSCLTEISVKKIKYNTKNSNLSVQVVLQNYIF